MSVPAAAERQRPAEAIAGLLAAAAIATAGVGIAYKPVRLVPVALALALVAAALGGRHSRLAAVAVTFGALAFVLGTTIAVLTSHKLF